MIWCENPEKLTPLPKLYKQQFRVLKEILTNYARLFVDEGRYMKRILKRGGKSIDFKASECVNSRKFDKTWQLFLKEKKKELLSTIYLDFPKDTLTHISCYKDTSSKLSEPVSSDRD